MASLSQIRAAARDTITAAIPSLHGYDTVPDVALLPALVVVPVTADFVVTMGRGTDTWELDLIVMVSTGDVAVGQATLDAYVSGAGPQSIRQAVYANRSLSLPGTDVHVSGLTAYNMAFSAAQVDHIAATLRLIVHTDGTV